MQKIIVFLILTLITDVRFQAIASENLLKNGDFDKGTSAWGNFKTELIDSNNVCVVEASTVAKKLQQSFTAMGLKEVELTFKYKASPEYKGKGFQVQINKEQVGWNQWYFRNVAIKDNAEWSTFKMKYDKFQSSGIYSIKIEIHPGAGKLYFDDIVLVSNGK
jgi:hypothetical protein